MGTANTDSIKRVFVVSDSDFPGLDATSNYIRSLGQSLMLSGMDVYVFSVDRKADSFGDSSWKREDNGINYLQLPYPITGKLMTALSRLTFSRRVKKEMQKLQVSSKDRVLLYAMKSFAVKGTIKNCKRLQIPIFPIVVEWFEGESKNQEECFKAYEDGDGIIAISENIRIHFQKAGLKTMILPPMISSIQTKTNSKTDLEHIHFLYTGNFVKKDDMKVMLEALALLSGEKRKLIRFYITRFDDQSLIDASGISEDTWETVKDSVITCGDVDKNRLQELLKDTDFLPIARQRNRTTISNIPSKVPEAMSYGIVPIMTNVGDCPKYYLTDGVDSIIFAECTKESCREAYERAIEIWSSDKYLQMKDNAQKTVEKRFSIEVYSDSLREFIK